MKKLLIFFGLVLLPLCLMAAGDDYIIPTAQLELQTIQSIYQNGDKIELSASGFAVGDRIVAAVLIVNNIDGSYDYKIIGDHNLSLDPKGELSGSLTLTGIDENDISAQIAISSLKSSVIPTELFEVIGDIPNLATHMNNESAPFAFTEASGDNVAQLNEQFNITTPNSGWTGAVVLCFRREYSTGDATGTPIASVSLSTANLAIAAGQLSGNTNNGTTAYNASTLTMRLDIMDGSFLFGTSTTFFATFADTIPPNLTAAYATSLDTIRLQFDEAVNEVGGGDASGKFDFGGTVGPSITASAVLPIGTEPTTMWNLVISGLTDRGVGNLTVAYDSTNTGATELQDDANNIVRNTSPALTVLDSIPPDSTVLRDSSNSVALTVGEFLGNTTYVLRARVLNGNLDSSMDGVVFEGSDNGSAWTTIGTDATPTTVVDSLDFEVTWNIATLGQFRVLRARAFDDAGASGSNGALDADDNVTASDEVGSPTNGFNDNFEDTYRALITTVNPDPVEASTGTNRAQITIQLQNNYGGVVNTTGINNTFRFSESTTTTESWWSVATGGTPSSTQIDLTVNSSSTSGSVWYSNTLAGGPYTLVLTEPAGNFAANDGVVTANNETISVITGNPSLIWVQLPGQTFVSGTGVTGTPDDSTTSDTLVVGLFVTDNANNLINFDETRNLEFETTASDAPNGTQPSVNNNAISSASPTTISITFVDGSDSANVHFPAVQTGVTLTANDTTVTDTLGGVTSSGVDITPSALDSFEFVMSSPQRDGEVVTGTNTLAAWDLYENVITGFDAATNNVTITGNGPGSATITGLGSGSNNVLNQTSDFTSGVADLTAQSMNIDVSIPGTYSFTATSGTATGQVSNIAVNRVVNVSSPNTAANTIIDTTITATDFTLSASLDGSENSGVGDDFRIRWGFNSTGTPGSYGLVRQSPDRTPGATIEYVVTDDSVQNLGASYDYMFWWVENISTNPNATILEGLPVLSDPRRLILNPNLVTLGGINGGDVAQGNFTPGVNNQEVVSVLFQCNPSATTIQITTLTFDKTGTATATDVDTFQLYIDGGTLGQYDQGVDVLLSTVSYSGGTSVSFSNIPSFNISGTVNYILVTVDVTAGATTSNTLGLRLPDEDAITLGDNVFNGPSGAITRDPFTDIGTSTDYALPVNLVSFQARAGFDEIILEWSTASEQSNAGFYLMRSTEEEGEYARLNTELIEGQGNSNVLYEYSYKDSEVQPEVNYFYKLYSVDFSGTVHVYESIASASANILPKEFALAQNYPNPFNPTTKISFDVAKESSISLEIYNMLGQKIRSLIDNQRYQPGVYSEVIWDAKDDQGNSVANGIYYLVYSAKDYGHRQVRKMVFMK
jgi:hypothetical protein